MIDNIKNYLSDTAKNPSIIPESSKRVALCKQMKFYDLCPHAVLSKFANLAPQIFSASDAPGDIEYYCNMTSPYHIELTTTAADLSDCCIENKNATADLTGRVDDIEDRVNTTETTLTGLPERVEKNANDIQVLNSNVTSLATLCCGEEGGAGSELTATIAENLFNITALEQRVEDTEACCQIHTESLTNATNGIKTLQGNVTTLADCCNEARTNTTELVERVETLEETSQTHTYSIDELQKKTDENKDGIDGLDQRVTINEVDIRYLNSTLTAYGSFAPEGSEAHQFAQDFIGQLNDTATLIDTVETLEECCKANEAGLTEVKDDVNTLQANATQAKACCNQARTNTTNLDNRVTIIENYYTNTSSQVDSLKSNVSTLQTNATQAAACCNEARTNITELKERLTIDEEQVQENKENIEILQAATTDLADKVDKNENDIIWINSTIHTLNLLHGDAESEEYTAAAALTSEIANATKVHSEFQTGIDEAKQCCEDNKLDLAEMRSDVDGNSTRLNETAAQVETIKDGLCEINRELYTLNTTFSNTYTQVVNNTQTILELKSIVLSPERVVNPTLMDLYKNTVATLNEDHWAGGLAANENIGDCYGSSSGCACTSLPVSNALKTDLQVFISSLDYTVKGRHYSSSCDEALMYYMENTANRCKYDYQRNVCLLLIEKFDCMQHNPDEPPTCFYESDKYSALQLARCLAPIKIGGIGLLDGIDCNALSFTNLAVTSPFTAYSVATEICPTNDLPVPEATVNDNGDYLYLPPYDVLNICVTPTPIPDYMPTAGL